jgi:MATE family multidrug resistance protein
MLISQRAPASGRSMSYLTRRFFRLSLINIASTVTVPLVGLVDTAMLGHLPDIRFLAGVALASLLFVNSSSVLGTLFLAANSILLRLQALASYMIDGTAFASEALAGIFRGQRDVRALQRLFRLSLGTGLGFALLFLAGLFAAERPILRLLTSHDDVIATSAAYAWWLAPVLVFGSLAYMYDGLFLGLTEGRRLRNAMLLSTFVVFLPACGAALWLASNHALWAAMALFMLARTATLWVASRGALASPVGKPSVP